MTKVLMLGSSHLGAVKRGWDRVSTEYTDFDVEFFGGPARTLQQMKMTPDFRFGCPANSPLTPQEVAIVQRIFGRIEVTLSDYDVVVVIGYRIEELLNARLLTAFCVEGLSDGEDCPPMTRASYDALIDGYLTTRLPDPVWRNLPRTRVIHVAKPRFADGFDEEAGGNAPHWSAMVRSGRVSPASLVPFMDRAIAIFQQAGFPLIVSPPEVFGPTGLTQARFSRAFKQDAGENLSGNHFDYTHMNADFGEIMARRIMTAISTKQ